MLRETGEAIIALLADDIPQIEFYNGQFENFDEQIINPPAAYLDYQSGEPSEVDDPLGTNEMVLYVMTSSLDRDPGNMLDLLETVVKLVHKMGLRDSRGGYLGRCFYKGWKNNTTFPGLLVWEVVLQVRR